MNDKNDWMNVYDNSAQEKQKQGIEYVRVEEFVFDQSKCFCIHMIHISVKPF